ncbi:MAG: hypothetical protein K1X67_22490 [Fimbriimonadaceae bacterium]|nr:hypothetical protein [Fimbriimonadaceae bacterium]
MRLTFAIIAVTVVGQASMACRWDSDTLEFEARQLPDVVQTIAGRFDRNPPLYYEMRLARVSKEVLSNPKNLNLYDDAGVACDVLGKYDDAIRWMERKQKVMLGLPDTAEKKEHEYRYFANLGTFEAHRWFADGADREKLLELKQAEAHVLKAIEINPDAHFGRELVQAKVLHWIINQGHEALKLEYLKPIPNDKIQKGLCGLIVLGNAWESIDVFSALAQSCYQDRTHGGDFGLATLSSLAMLRIGELYDAGKRPLVKDEMLERGLTNDRLSEQGLTWQKEDILDNYTKLRANGNAYHEHRTEFMLTKLRKGLHPDTDPSFWDGYTPIPAYKIPPKWIPIGPWIMRNGAILLPLICLFIAVGIPAIFFVLRAKLLRRRARMA